MSMNDDELRFQESRIYLAYQEFTPAQREAYEWGLGCDNARAKDIANRVAKVDNINTNQMAYLVRMHGEHKALEGRAVVDAPSGRTEITGTVLNVYKYEGTHYPATRITVLADAGYIVTGTRPKDLQGVHKGVRVRFRATLKPTYQNPRRAIFSRPSNAVRLEGEL